MKPVLAIAGLMLMIPGAAQSHVIEWITGLGQWFEVDPGIRVQPVAVIEDSRCPVSTNCVWAGRVIITVRVRDHGRRSTARFTLGQPLKVGKGMLTLDQVLPEKRTGALPPREYRFGFSYAPALPKPSQAAPL